MEFTEPWQEGPFWFESGMSPGYDDGLSVDSWEMSVEDWKWEISVLQMAEVVVSQVLFATILERIQRFGAPPPLVQRG